LYICNIDLPIDRGPNNPYEVSIELHAWSKLLTYSGHLLYSRTHTRKKRSTGHRLPQYFITILTC
jgi:hypothetical protein